MKKILLIPLLFFCTITIYGQNSKKNKHDKNTVSAIDTTKKAAESVSPIKPYSEIITSKAISATGLFKIHKVVDKWYMEIPDSILNRQMMAITRFVKTPAGGGFYGGEAANEQTVYWEKGPEDKILLRVSTVVNVADSSQAIYKAVLNTSVNPIAATFDIKAFSKDKKGVVIDVTSFFKDDNQIVSLDPALKRKYNLSGLEQDRSFIEKISTYPINTEIRTLKTYMANPPAFGGNPFGGGGPPQSVTLPAAAVAGAVTLEMNTSFILLPKVPMHKRFYDPRVGYFYDEYSSFTDNDEKAEISRFILRWRLEPRPEDMEKFKRGELVEPAKPIVYYIDPATPKKWRPYLIQGINDWQKAFERAGFKNAIIGKEWPENDTTMSLEDARFSVVRYFASPISNAYGPNVHDPRSGEIIESHVGWYSNVTDLIHNWYMVQAGTSDPRARTMHFSDELMGQLIRFVSSHEIGHTLGLRHNFGSSSLTPVEKLRDKAWVEAHGHTASIMDYARFNYVAQPEDSIGPAGLYPRIGPYDKWAIEWGYRPIFNAKDAKDEREILNEVTIDSLKADKWLWFGSEDVINDPRIQSEDLGDNSMKAGDYGIKNLKRVIAQLPKWTFEPADQYDNLNEIYHTVVEQYAQYLRHVINNIGGSYHDPKSVEQPGPVFYTMTREKQKEAVDFLNRNLFTQPEWLIKPAFICKITPSPDYDFYKLADAYFSQLLSGHTYVHLMEFAKQSKGQYTLDEFLTDIERDLFSELSGKKAITEYHRHFQKAYINDLFQEIYIPRELGGNPEIFGEIINTDAASIVKAHLAALKIKINTALPLINDNPTRMHLKDISERISVILNRRK